MNTTFILTGGAGRTVCSVPALEKYARLNPNDDFKIIVHGWDMIFWSHPVLQDKVFNSNQKGLFETIVKPNKIIHPEPYQVHEFFNEKVSLIEAYDICINNTNDHSDLNRVNYLYLSQYEKKSAIQYISEEKHKKNKRYCVMTQPYGSGTRILNHEPHDDTSRSIKPDHYEQLINHLKEDCVVLYGSKDNFKKNNDKTTVSFENIHPALPYMRILMSLISECDYFIGCDSVGQHIAKAFGKKGLILMGSTGDIPFSYPRDFTIYRKAIPKFFPWRLAEPDAVFAARANDNMMDFNSQQKEEINKIIDKELRHKI
jgi:hypothetical protein